MSAALEANGASVSESELIKRGVGLLSQQIWCWGRDILRPEGNWLVEIGCDRVEPPSDREKCSSVYTLRPSPDRRVVLRGFGVFYGDDRFGGVFLPRYEFRPKYTLQANLDCPPWTEAELPELGPPNKTQRDAYAALTSNLIDWIRAYEADVLERLGLAYRLRCLEKWNNGKRPFTPAADVVGAWTSLGAALSAKLGARP